MRFLLFCISFVFGFHFLGLTANAQPSASKNSTDAMEMFPYSSGAFHDLRLFQTKKGWGVYSLNDTNWRIQPEYEYIGQLGKFVVGLRLNRFTVFDPASGFKLAENLDQVEASFSGDWYFLLQNRWCHVYESEIGARITDPFQGEVNQGNSSTHSARIIEGKVFLSCRTVFHFDRLPYQIVDPVSGDVRDSTDNDGNLIFHDPKRELLTEVYDLKKKKRIFRSLEHHRVNPLVNAYLLVRENAKQIGFLYSVIDLTGKTILPERWLSDLANDPKLPVWLGLKNGAVFSRLMVNEKYDFYTGHHQLNITTPKGSGILDLERMKWKVAPVYEVVFAPHMQDFYLAYDKGKFYFLHPDSTKPLFSVAGTSLSYEFGRNTEFSNLYGRLEVGERIWLHHLDEGRRQQVFDEYQQMMIGYPARKTFRLDVRVEDSVIVFSLISPQLISHSTFLNEDVLESPKIVEQEYFERMAIYDRKRSKWIIALDEYTTAVKRGKNWLLWSRKNGMVLAFADENGVAGSRKKFNGTPEDFSAITGVKIDQVRALDSRSAVMVDSVRTFPVILRSGNLEGLFDMRSLSWIHPMNYHHIACVPNTTYLILISKEKMLISDPWGSIYGEAINNLEYNYSQFHFVADERIIVPHFAGSTMTVHDVQVYNSFEPVPVKDRFAIFSTEAGRVILDYLRGKGEMEIYDEYGDVTSISISTDTTYNKAFTRTLSFDGKIKSLNSYFDIQFHGGNYICERLDGTVITDHEFNELITFPGDKMVFRNGNFIAVAKGDQKVSSDAQQRHSYYDVEDVSGFFIPAYDVYTGAKKINIPDSLIATAFAGHSRILFSYLSGFPYYLGLYSEGKWVLTEMAESSDAAYGAGPDNWIRLMQNSSGEWEVRFYNRDKVEVRERANKVEMFFHPDGEIRAVALIDTVAIRILDHSGKILQTIPATFSQVSYSSPIAGADLLLMDTTIRYFSNQGKLCSSTAAALINVSPNENRLFFLNVKNGKTEILNRARETVVVLPGVIDTVNTDPLFIGSYIQRVKLKHEKNYRWYTRAHTSQWESIGNAPIAQQWSFSPAGNEFVQEFGILFLLTETGELIRMNNDGSIHSRWTGVSSIEPHPERGMPFLFIKFTDAKKPALTISLL
jgi:hypothetical protein